MTLSTTLNSTNITSSARIFNTHIVNKLKLFFLFGLIGIAQQTNALDLTVAVGESIQTAIDQVASSGGGTVTLEAGTHIITNPILIKSNITLTGEGDHLGIIKTDDNMQCINAASEGLVNITIDNIEIIGINGVNGGGIQITSQSTNHNNIILKNVHVYETGWGVHIKGADNVTIEDCDFSRNGAVTKEGFAHNLYIRRCTTTVVQNCILNNSISANGINISYSVDIEVHNCQMIGNYFRGVRAAVSDQYLVHDCVIKNNGDIGILANSETGGFTTTNCDWQNNCVENNRIGISGGASGVCENNNSFNNVEKDYNVGGGISQSGNTSDANIACEPPTATSTIFIHPGITHKKSDLDRMKYMVESQIDPWYSSYQTMSADSKSDYDYNVQGDPSFKELGRDNKVNYGAWNNDIRAAYYNAIRYYISGDERHAQKAVEIFNAWVGIEAVTSNGTQALSGGVGYIMIEAAEIIKHTYSGWAESDRQKFEDMLVFPGYSNTAVPNGVSRTYGSFYWQAYQGDAGRHGNQGLSGWRTVMAIGIFLDNEIIYDRALRYIKGLPHRSDDLPYPSGAPTSNSITGSDEYADTYSTSRGSSIEDYGYNELMTNYIWETGQCQESSRDQQHVMFGLGLLTSMSEMAWNQGDDLYGFEDARLLQGLEYSMKYNISAIESYPDQPSPWVPSVTSGEFSEGFDRTGRWYSKAISPIGIGGIDVRPVFEMSTAHYYGRGLKTDEETKWITRTRDLSIDMYGYERAGWTNDAPGWGGLTARRPEGCKGDPIDGFESGKPSFCMNILPTTIEAENFDHFVLNGNGRTYYDNDAGNEGNSYRTDEDVDIQVCDEGGYNVGWLYPDEWMTYTVYVPTTGTYDISIRYSGNSGDGTIQFDFDGKDKTGEVDLPATGGWQNWQDFNIGEGILLAQGVQSLKVRIGGSNSAINLNHFTINNSTSCVQAPPINETFLKSGIHFKYYEGTWNNVPDFFLQTAIDSGITTDIGLGLGERSDDFAYAFSGYLNIETDGEYTFFTSSDDGSLLHIDDVQIVNNDGTHGNQERSGSICLQPGYHKIDVGYFENSGGNTLNASYEGPGVSKQTITDLHYLSDDVVLANSFKSQPSTDINVYPNPTTGSIQFSSSINFRLVDTLGIEITSGKGSLLDISGQANGLYFLEVSTPDDSKLFRVIKN